MNIEDVPSPCINVCVIDESNQRCKGCERTIEEITLWGTMDSDAKQAVIDLLPERHRRSGR